MTTKMINFTKSIIKPFNLTFFRPYFLRFDFSKTVYRGSLISLCVISFLILVLIKSKTAVEFRNDPLLFTYSIFITVFIFSRLFNSLFYKYSLARIIKKGSDNSRGGYYEPSVSFVIPCKNEGVVIAKTITKCFDANYPKDKTEVIVVNDGSTDNTVDVLKELKKKYKKLVIVDWKINRGKRHGMAEGFRMAKGEIIIQLDSDSYIDPKTFRNLIKPFQNPEIGAVCAHADPTNENENVITRIQAAYYFMSFRILKAAESTFMSVFCCSGCSSAYRKSVVLPILDDWLNESFLGKPVTWGDDRALTSWVLKLGHKAIYTDEVKAFTIVPNNIKQFFKQQLRWKKSWIINGLFTSRFIYKQHLFIALFYFFPLLLISFLTPFMVFRAMIYSPVIKGVFPFYYLLGSILITSIIVIFYRLYAPENKNWIYLYLWLFLNSIVFSYIIIYAALRIQDRGWGNKVSMKKTILKIKIISSLAVVLTFFALSTGVYKLNDNPIFTNSYLVKTINYFKYRREYSDIAINSLQAYEHNKKAKSIPVLLYHGVISSPDGTNILVEDFKNQMFALKKAGWQTITLEDFYAFMRGEKQVPDKSFLLTFDDGRRDSYYPVDPILKVLGYNAVMFIDTRHSINLGGNNYYLSPEELSLILRSGHWELQSHGRNAHSLYQLNKEGKMGTYLGNKLWLADKNRLENDTEFKDRVRGDLSGSIDDIKNKFDVKVISFAFPFGDYGQYSNNEDLVSSISSSIFPISFYQYKLGTFTNNYPFNGGNFFAKRIIADDEWTGVDLINALENASSKELPFYDDFSSDGGWIKSWGRVGVKDGFMVIGAHASTTGSAVFLDGTYLWRDYKFKADVNLAKGQTFSLIARYKDDKNYITCAFSEKSIRVEQLVNGEKEILSELKGDFSFTGIDREVGMGVHDNTVNCYLDGKIAMKGYDLDENLSNGGIGFKTWNPQVNNSELIIKSASVEEIK